MSNQAPSKPMLRVLAGETLTPPPFWLMRQAGRYLPEYRAIRGRLSGFLELCYTPELATEVTLQPLRRYAMDAAILFSDILVVPDALGQAVSFREGEGPSLAPIRSTGDLDRLDPSRLHAHLAPVYETVRRLKTAIPPATTLIGFAGAPWTIAAYMFEGGGSRDFLEVKKVAYGQPGLLQAAIDLVVAATTEYLVAQIDAGAEVIQLFDSWAGVLPEDEFRRWVIAPNRAIVEQVKSRRPGVPIIGFPRGAGVLYEAFAAETGVDAVSLDTTVPLSWAAARLQPKCVVQGNLDPVMLMTGGEAMDAAIDRILDAFGKGPFIFNLGHGIQQGTPPENVARLAARIRQRR